MSAAVALTKAERECMLHALDNLKTAKHRGRARKLASCRRNYFAADWDLSSGDGALWRGLASRGLAELRSGPRPGFPYNCFCVTEAGFAALRGAL